MRIEEQLIRIAEAHGLAALCITVHNVPEMEPWISVGVQVRVEAETRVQGNGDVRQGEEIAPAIHRAITELHTKIADHHGIAALAPLADSEGEKA